MLKGNFKGKWQKKRFSATIFLLGLRKKNKISGMMPEKKYPM